MFTEFYQRTLRPLFRSGPTGEAKIAVVGVGGGGGNAVNNMVRKGIPGVDFIAINTDSQVLATNEAGRRIQIGKQETGGLGAGARPEVGATAVEESHDEIARALQPYDMVFVTAGMGGGTGTGGAPIVAAIAQEMGVLTVGIVTRPFACEGPRRSRLADQGIKQLRAYADTSLVIPNEQLLDLASDSTSLEEAFWMADEVLYDATCGIVDLITYEGLVNLDFADVERTMKDGGTALLGISNQFSRRQHRSPRGKAVELTDSGDGAAKHKSRPEEAALEAISSPLFDGRSIQGADKVLVNVTGGPSLGFQEAMSATEIIQEQAGEQCEVIFGAVTDKDMEGQFQVTVIATGLMDEDSADETVQMTDDEWDPLKGLEDHLSDEEAPGDPVSSANGSQ